MDCKKIRDFLITDYLDAELKPQLRQEIEEHLKSCSQCRKLEGDLEELHRSFKEAKHIEPLAQVWQRIRESIEAKQAPVLRGWIWPVPKPVFAFATVAALIILLAIFVRLPVQPKIITNGRNGIADYSLEEDVHPLYDFGTDIEKYFL